MTIENSILVEFKDRMHLDGDEDYNLMRILVASNEELVRACGDYDINTSETFKELVFERSRYAYNDALEYFNSNFLNQINSLGIEKVLLEIILEVVADETI